MASLAVLGVAAATQAVTLVTSLQSISSGQATYNLSLDFSDSLPADLGEINVARISVVGSDAALDGRFSFVASPEWDLIKNFGDAPDPAVAELLWSLSNPDTGLAPGALSQLGQLKINLSGLSGQTLEFRLDGGSDPLVDQTAVIGPDTDDPSGISSVAAQTGFAPDSGGAQIVVPAGTGIPEPVTGALSMLSLAALGLSVARRR